MSGGPDEAIHVAGSIGDLSEDERRRLGNGSSPPWRLLQPERSQDVRCGEKRGGALAQEIVRAPRQRRSDLPWNRENFASQLECEVRGDERSGALACFDDDRRDAEPGNDPISRGKAPLT
jgi:hypothetical protein